MITNYHLLQQPKLCIHKLEHPADNTLGASLGEHEWIALRKLTSQHGRQLQHFCSADNLRQHGLPYIIRLWLRALGAVV